MRRVYVGFWLGYLTRKFDKDFQLWRVGLWVIDRNGETQWVKPKKGIRHEFKLDRESSGGYLTRIFDFMWIFNDDIWRWHLKIIFENNIWREYLTSERSHMWDSQEERACWYDLEQVFLRFYPPDQQGLIGRIQKKGGFQDKDTDQSVTLVYSNIFVICHALIQIPRIHV